MGAVQKKKRMERRRWELNPSSPRAASYRAASLTAETPLLPPLRRCLAKAITWQSPWPRAASCSDLAFLASGKRIP